MTSTTVTASDLEITEDAGEEGTLVNLRGRLSIDSSPAFRDLLLVILRRLPPAAVVVDLSEVSYMDASGVATLVEGLKTARNRQTTLCLQGLQGRVRHLFEVTGLLTLFETTGCGSTTSAAKVS
ncbi:MAG: STAS domain-containing protein [Terracidiphilus sp.]